MQEPNQEQLILLEFLYDNRDRKFHPNELKERNIPFHQDDWKSLNKMEYLSYTGIGDALVSITPAGRTYVEWYRRHNKEMKEQKQYENKLLSETEKANNISVKANKYALIALIVSAIVSSITLLFEIIQIIMENL